MNAKAKVLPRTLSRLYQAYFVEWDGPRRIENINDSYLIGCLYLAVGSQSENDRRSLQYCGQTSQLMKNRVRGHHVFPKLQSGYELWLGRLMEPQATSPHLRRAEALLIKALQLPQNVQGLNAKLDPTLLVSRWKLLDGRSHTDRPQIPDIIYFDGQQVHRSSLEWWSR